MQTRFSIFSILFVLLLGLNACVAPVAPAAAPQSQVVDRYANPEVLVDTQWVLDHLNDANARFIDVSGKQETFDNGHLAGAVYINLQSLTNPEDSTRGQILTQDALSALLSGLGVTHENTLVFYDDANNLLAARAYWVLKYYQHGDVRIYNGGTKKWIADGQSLTTEAAEFAASDYIAKEADLTIRTTAEYVLEHLDDPGTVLCDARSPGEYIGTDVRAKRGGHIPDAINIEWIHAVNEDGAFKDARSLYELYSKAGFTPDKEIITYCQTGVRGAHTWFVLRELLGYPNVRNYDGSWEEYGNRDDTPVQS
jgi:thiosulfate/3-mercaptopyruvate sulfurtransferase